MVIGVDVGKITTMAIYKKGNVEIRQFEIGTAGLIDFFEWMRRIMSYYKTNKKENLFYVEDVHSMPTDGKKSAFTFGYSVGYLRALLDCYKLPYELIRPQVWRKFTKTKDKKDSIAFCKEYYPNVSLLPTERSKKDNHNIADAICIMHYGLNKDKE